MWEECTSWAEVGRPLPGAVGSGGWGVAGRGRGRRLTSMKEQLTMSRIMQPRDQTSAFWLKEKLRASGAIQDLWKGSAGRETGDT